MLALAGGLTDLADRKVTIQRHASKERVKFVVSNSANAALDASVSVFPGDTVIVPKADVVYILGDVNRPGGIRDGHQRLKSYLRFRRFLLPGERRPMPFLPMPG